MTRIVGSLLPAARAALMGGWAVTLVAAAGLAGYAAGRYALLPLLMMTGWPA